MSASALPPSDPAPGRSPVPEGDGTPWERRAPQRASLVADLLAGMEREPLTPFGVDPQDVEALADRLVRAGWRRVTEDPPKPREFVVFDMEPDDVVLIGGVRDVESANALTSWAREQWPDREIVCFRDEIDVRLLREFEGDDSAAVLRGGEQPGQASGQGLGEPAGGVESPQVRCTGQGGGEQP